jgi:hypothetical protein
MGDINIYNNNTLNRPDSFNQKISVLKDIPLSVFSRAYKNKKENNEKSEYDINLSQIGFYIPYALKNKNNLIEYLDVNFIEVDNLNNQVSNYMFNVLYNLPEKINNVHYINVYKIILPRYPVLIKTEISNDIIDFSYLINNLQTIKIGENYIYNDTSFNIHNIYIQDNIYDINFSINDNYSIVYQIIIKDNSVINTYKYKLIDKPIDYFYPLLILSIKGFDNIQFYSTNQYNIFNYLTPKTKKEHNIYYAANDCFKIFPMSNLVQLNKLHITILTNNNQPIFENQFNHNNFDTHIMNNKCNCMLPKNTPGCICTYLRNKNNHNYCCYITLQIGIIKNDLVKKLIY